MLSSNLPEGHPAKNVKLRLYLDPLCKFPSHPTERMTANRGMYPAENGKFQRRYFIKNEGTKTVLIVSAYAEPPLQIAKYPATLHPNESAELVFEAQGQPDQRLDANWYMSPEEVE